MNLETFLQKTDAKFKYEQNEGKVYNIKHWELYVPNNKSTYYNEVKLMNYNVVVAIIRKDSDFQTLYDYIMKEDNIEEKIVKKVLNHKEARWDLAYRMNGEKEFNLFCKELKECYNYFFGELPEEIDLLVVWESLKDEIE